jgi:hypothetical protein
MNPTLSLRRWADVFLHNSLWALQINHYLNMGNRHTMAFLQILKLAVHAK